MHLHSSQLLPGSRGIGQIRLCEMSCLWQDDYRTNFFVEWVGGWGGEETAEGVVLKLMVAGFQ